MCREQSQFVLEIRYQPNAKVLDHRGKWAESVAAQTSLPHWVIVDSRRDIFDEEQTTRCFVGFRNVGYVTHASDSPLTRKLGKYLSCGYASRISSVAIALRIIPAVSARC
jgi:hypothetical protein